MSIEFDGSDPAVDETYFDSESSRKLRVFDAELLRHPLSVLPTRSPLIFAPKDSVSAAMRSAPWALYASSARPKATAAPST